MSQGPRGGWVRTIFAGLGAVVCASFVGCTDIDKPKLGANTKQPGPGLPGTARLPGQPGAGAAQPGTNSGLQPGMGTPAGRTPAAGFPASGNTNFGTGSGGNSFVPSVTPNNNYPPAGAAPISPATGMGAGSPAGLPAGYSTQPALADPGLYPPAAPDSRGGPVAPPGSGPMAPYKPY